MDGEVEMIQCFFNRSHMIFRSRYPYHYQRCSRQHPHIKHKVCPYNATHVMNPDHYQVHLTKCESRPPPSMLTPSPVWDSTPVDPWEEPEDTWGTNELLEVIPSNLQQQTFIYTPLIGGSKAERKKHRLAERRQYCEYENSIKSQSIQSNDNKTVQKKKKMDSSNNNNSSNNNFMSNSEDVNNSMSKSENITNSMSKSENVTNSMSNSENVTNSMSYSESVTNSKWNKENANYAPSNKPMATKVGTVPLAERKIVEPQKMNFAALFKKK